MPEPETSREAFVRGQASGKVDARLEGHDDHFQRINGSISELIAEVRGVSRAVQQLADKFEASEKTVVTTAAALKDAKAVEQEGWSPLARWSTGIGIVVALVTLALLVLK